MKHIFTKLGFVERNIGCGEFAMEKRFPGGHFVWITGEEGGIEFLKNHSAVVMCAYDQDAQLIGECVKSDSSQFEESLTKICQIAYKSGVAALNIEAEIDDAINAAFCHLQDKMGVTDGGFAALFMSGPNEKNIKDILRTYAQSELAQTDQYY